MNGSVPQNNQSVNGFNKHDDGQPEKSRPYIPTPDTLGYQAASEIGSATASATANDFDLDAILDMVDANTGRSEGTSEATTPSTGSSMPPLPAEAYLDPSVAEGASPWLDAYIEHSRRWSPRSYDGFHEAAGLWALSTVASRRVGLHLGGKRFTSLYITLATRTSIYAKTTGTKVCMGMLEEAGLSYLLAADDATPQAFVKALAGHLPSDWADMPREKQLLIEERLGCAGQRGWFYEEFGQKVSAMMKDGGHMADFRGLLRKFDDTPDVYEYASIARGNDKVAAPYLALLANLTPADLKPFAKKGAALWGDGFWARFAFITAPPSTPRSKARFPDGERVTPPALVSKLKAWHKRLGIPKAKITEKPDADGASKSKAGFDLTIDPPAPHYCTLGDGVKDAYYNYQDALLDIVAESPNQDLAGNYARFGEKALRVAMLLGSLENNGRIEMPHWARAQQIAESWRQGLHYFYDEVTGAAQSPGEAVEEKIMQLIAGKGPLTRREIHTAIRGIDSGMAGMILGNMVAADLLEESEGGQTKRYGLVG